MGGFTQGSVYLVRLSLSVSGIFLEGGGVWRLDVNSPEGVKHWSGYLSMDG